jgi:sulfate adenylyltransferase subunit 2
VHRNEQAIAANANPADLGTRSCCDLLKTQALLTALRQGGFDAAFGGARRDEERSRAKERIYSFRSKRGQWDPRAQRPELWNLYNGTHRPGESIRVFPLSNWTEIDIWRYIAAEQIDIVPLYLAKQRAVVVRGTQLVPIDDGITLTADDRVEMISCRFRSLGCSPCTGAVPSEADTIEKIIEELQVTRTSERVNRAIDHDQDGSMELKKQQGYF